jgi:hypothetical protein
MATKAVSVEGLRGRLACIHERFISDAPSLAHLRRPEQRARLAARLLAPYHRLSPADFELLLVDWMEADPLPSVVEVCSLLGALLSVDATEPASTIVDLVVEAIGRTRRGKKAPPEMSVVWWAHCICERCEPLAKHLPTVQKKLRDCLLECDADLPMFTSDLGRFT